MEQRKPLKDQIDDAINDIEQLSKSNRKYALSMLRVLKWTKRKLELTLINEKQKDVVKEAKKRRLPRPQPLLVSRGEIWNCELGVNVGSEQSQDRPVLIIQNDENNKVSPNTIVVPLTRAIHRLDKTVTGASGFIFDESVAESLKVNLRKTEVLILPDEAKEDDGSILPEPSVIMCQNIKEISKSRLKDKITSVNDEKWVDINKALAETLGLIE